MALDRCAGSVGRARIAAHQLIGWTGSAEMALIGRSLPAFPGASGMV